MTRGSLVSLLTFNMNWKVRDMLSHDIIHQTVILDNYVEGSLPKGLANQMGLAILTRLVPPRPNLGDYFFLYPI